MKILLTGRDGQIGAHVYKKLLPLCEVIATNRHELDLLNCDAIRTLVDKIKPDIIINAAAYTKVDQAEYEAKLAYQINTVAPKIFAEKAKELNIPLIHFSTNYVFDGLKKEPYIESDKVNPQSVYGRYKWEGEVEVRKHKKHIILRTGWVFSGLENNFLNVILKMLQEKESLNVVNDQQGTPTSAHMLADITSKIVTAIMNNLKFKDFGTFHIVSDGKTDRYQYACLIYNEAIRLGLQTNVTYSNINATSSQNFSALAKRPLNSMLSNKKIKKTFMLKLPNWEDEVKKTLKEIFVK